MSKMGDSELKAVVEAKLNNALGWLGGALSKARILALSYYRGDLFGNEQEGRSKVVSRDVAEAIDAAMPSLIKMFVTTETVVVFSPRRKEDEAAAQQATDYINWVWQTLPNSFDLLQTWLKSGLLSQLGVVKSWWDDSQDITTEDYEGQTRFQLLTLLSDDEVELVKLTPQKPDTNMIDPGAVALRAQAKALAAQQQPAPGTPQPPQAPGMLPRTPANVPGMAPGGITPPAGAMAPAPGQPTQPPSGMGSPSPAPMPAPSSASGDPLTELDDGALYDCTIRRTKKRGKICVESLPPEEFLTERRAVTLDPQYCGFAAHRSRRTVTDLIEMGYDKKLVESLPGSDEMDFNQETINRFRPEDQEPRRDADAVDPSMRGVWFAESYLKVDYDGDGIAEWRQVNLAGGGGLEILDNEVCDGHPFCAWTPYKQPHKLFGEGMADKTLDLQLIKSTVWRQILDGMYFNNAPQLTVIEGQANMEDVVTRRPGGVIRMKSAGAVMPLPVQDSSGSGFQMISYLDSVRETRTGIRRFSSGLNADELNPYASTATGANLVEDASQDALMLIARNFAETGLKPLFKRMLELTCKYQDKAQTVRLRGKWVDIDPSTWTTEMDMTVTVGLGTGNHDRQVAQLQQMLTQIDVPIVQLQGGVKGPMLTLQNVYNKIKKLQEAMGYKEADGFYTDPATAPPQPPQQQQPDPKLQVEQVKGQNALQVVAAKAKADQANQAARVQADAAIEHLRAQMQADNDARDAKLDEWKAAQEHSRKTQEAAMKHVLDFVSKVHGAELQAHTAAQAHAAKAAAPVNGGAA